MSCADNTGCECGNNCGEDSAAICGAPEEATTLFQSHRPAVDYNYTNLSFGCAVCGGPYFPVSPCDKPACPHRIIG